MTQNLLQVDANLYRAAVICASVEPVRDYICCVRLEPHPDGGVVMIATDGHRMMVIRDHSGQCRKPFSFLLPPAGLLACKPSGKLKADPVRIVVQSDGSARVGSEYVSDKNVLVQGDYPDWRKVIPVQKWKNEPTSFNAHYLSGFAKIGDILNPSGHRSIRILTSEKDGPALILFPSFADAFGILMPMRADVGEGLPRWMIPVMRRKAKPAPKRKTKRK